MTSSSEDPDPALRLDGEWLRSFVRTLVPARHIDDVVQSTWLAALQSRDDVDRPRPWLRGIARNLARMLHRSDQRHRRWASFAGRPEPSPPTANVVAALEAQHAVSAAMLALPEPTRTIVVLRYREDLSPARIAERLNMDAAAVRQRLARGRAMVRARLQQEYGPEWRGCVAVAAFVGVDEVAAVSASANPIVAIGVALLLLASASLGIAWSGEAPNAVASGTADAGSVRGAAAQSTDPVDAVASDTHETERSLAATSEQEPQPTPTASTAAIELRGRFVAAETGDPIAGATVTVNAEWRRGAGRGRPKPEAVTSAADGRFVVAWPQDAVRATLWFDAAGRSPRWHDAEEAMPADLGDIPLLRGVAVRGRVVDEAERPMEGVRIAVQLDGEFPGPSGRLSYGTPTDANGSFTGWQLVPEGKTTLLCETDGVQLVDPAIEVTAQVPPQVFVLHAQRLPAIRGVVFGPEGVPCAGVALEAIDPAQSEFGDACGSCVSKKDGSFALFCEHGDPGNVVIRTSHHASHELAGDPTACEWGVSGVRIDVRPRIPVRLRVIAASDRKPIERFGTQQMQRLGDRSFFAGSITDMRDHEDGIVAFAGLAAGTRIVVNPADVAFPVAQLIVDEAMRGMALVELPIARLQTVSLTLVDARGNAVATEFDVIDRCGDTEPGPCNDPRGGRTCGGRACLRLSQGTTDAKGHAALLAPPDERDLVIALRRGDRDVWLPLVLPRSGQSLRMVVPD